MAVVMDKAALIEASKDSLNDDFEDREPVESFRAPLPELSSIKFRTEGDKLTKDEKKLLTHFQHLNNLRKIKKDLQAQVIKIQEEKKRKAEQEKTKKTQSSTNSNKLASAVQAKERAKLLLQSGAIKLPQARRANFIQHKRGMAQRNAEQKASAEEVPSSPGTVDKLSPEHDDIQSHKPEKKEQDGSPPVSKRQRINAPRQKLYDSFVSEGKEETGSPTPQSPQIPETSPSRMDSPRFRGDRTGNVLFVKGYELTKELLMGAFEAYGPVLSVKVDDEKGHAFVTLDSVEAAKLAKEQVNYHNRTILQVDFARKQNYHRTNNTQNNTSKRDRSAETWSNIASRGRGNSESRPKQDAPREMVRYD